MDNGKQKGMPEYDRYARRSLVFSLVSGCLLIVSLWLFGWLTELSVRTDNSVIGIIVLVGYPLAVICAVVLSVSGIIYGRKGLKSGKAHVAKAGIILSVIEISVLLIAAIILIIYFLAGGGFM